jgi:hypothetical protein
MTTAATALPLLGLRITAGPVELRGMTDDLLGPLADLAINGIHDPDLMPFSRDSAPGTSSSPASARPARGSAVNSTAAASAPRCGR